MFIFLAISRKRHTGTYYFQRELGDGVESSYTKLLAESAKLYSGNLRKKIKED